MKVFGFLVDELGLEFENRDDRDKGVLAVLKAAAKKVNRNRYTSGPLYLDLEASLALYQRDTDTVMVRCCKCTETFSEEWCSDRTYPYYAAYDKPATWRNTHGYICDKCYEKQVYDANTAKAKAAEAVESLNTTGMADDAPKEA